VANVTNPTFPEAAGDSPRQRIVTAALELVYEGGYDALQVRALAERAGVSSRTIYTHFESLDSLVVVAVAERAQPLYALYMGRSPRARTATARVRRLISELTAIMTENRTVTSALLRALLSGKPDVVPFVRAFANVLEGMLATAIAPDGPSPRDRQAAEILQCVWFAGLIGWAVGSDGEEHLLQRMDRTSRVLLAPS
jgi:TetR/AcrR family transcriptional regulator, cholesterol catabolism regulator